MSGAGLPLGPAPLALPDRRSSGRLRRTVESLERQRKLREAFDRQPRLRGRPARLLDPAPWAAPNEDRLHPGRGRGPDVVVESIADVGDLIRGQPELGRDPLEEPWVRLFDAPGLRYRHKLNGQAELGEDRLGLGRLIAGDAQSIAGIVQRAKAR